MHIKNGIRTTVRAKGRAVLFSLLILILTLTQTLGVGMWVNCVQLLNSFDETYTSIAVARYLDEDNPDEDIPELDAANEEARAALDALDGESLSAVDGVKLWEFTDSTLAFCAGYTRFSGTVPYKNYGVIVASVFSAMPNGNKVGIIDKSLYSTADREDVLTVFDRGDTDFAPEKGKKYLLHGEFIYGNPRIFVIKDFYEDCDTPPYLEISGPYDPAITDSLFAETANSYRVANNTLVVTASDNISALEPFQQRTLYLKEGRFPLAGETGVCVISGATTEHMDVSVGDEININILSSAADNRYAVSKSDDNRTWKVVGITNTILNAEPDYEGYIWVSGAEGGFSAPLFGCTVGRAVLQNSLASLSAASLQELMPANVQLTMYDQGYSAAARPINTMKTTSAAVTAASFCGTLVVLFLFSYMFVGRQRETVQVLVSLGTPNKKIRLWLLSGAALISFASSVSGAVIGHLSLGFVIKQALALSRSLYSIDLRYSNASLGIIKEPPIAGSVPLWCSAAVGAVVLTVSLLLCVVFLRHARKENTPKKGKSSVRVPKDKTSTFGHGALRFALLSAKRSGTRSAVVPAVALVLTVLLGILAVGSSGWEDQRNSLYENSTVRGQFVSTNGMYSTNLLVPASTARDLWKTGLLSEVGVSKSFKTDKQSELTATNSLSAVPEFYYTDQPEIEWLSGFDESFLYSDESYSVLRTLDFGSFGNEPMPTYPALVSSLFLESGGLSLGDETQILATIAYSFPPERQPGVLNFSVKYEQRNITIPIKIVGSFQQTGNKSNIYVPLSFWCDPALITGNDDILADGQSAPLYIVSEESFNKFYYSKSTFGTCRFTVSSPDNLKALKDFLEAKGYSGVGRLGYIRDTVLLLDSTFQEAVDSLNRYISFGKILFPVLFFVALMMGFVISWLMVNGRRMEFAILRGLGASKQRVFSTFFFEQAGLCVIGSLLGALALSVFSPIPAVWLTAMGFTVCYLTGSALSILYVSRIKLMLLLSERE